jgi:hypothetical protein
MSITPLKKAPSAILTHCVMTFPDQGTFTADVHTVAGIDVAAHLAQNHHFTGTDISRHLPIAPNRDTAAGQVDCARDFAVEYNDSEPITSPLTSRLLSILVTGSVATGDSEGGPASSCPPMVDKFVFIIVYPLVVLSA